MHFDDFPFFSSLMKYTYKLEKVRYYGSEFRCCVLTGHCLKLCKNLQNKVEFLGRVWILRLLLCLLMPATRSQMKSDKEKHTLISSIDQNCLVQLLSSFILWFTSACLSCFCKAHTEGIISESSCNGLG